MKTTDIFTIHLARSRLYNTKKKNRCRYWFTIIKGNRKGIGVDETKVYLQLVLCCVDVAGGGLEGPPTSSGRSSSSSLASERAVSSACLRYTDKLLMLSQC